MDEQLSTDPSGAPDPPPPAWRWETTASLGLLGALCVAFVPAVTDYLIDALRRETLFMLPVSCLAFGVVLGYSGARQGGRANRIAAILAMAFHVLLSLALLPA